MHEYFLQDWRAEKHGSEGKRAELRRKTELLQKRELSAQQNMNMSTHACTAALEASRTSRTSRIIMRKSTMVTFTSGDRHRFEPPRTQTAFIVCPKVNAKKLLQPTWLENYKALGFQTNSSTALVSTQAKQPEQQPPPQRQQQQQRAKRAGHKRQRNADAVEVSPGKKARARAEDSEGERPSTATRAATAAPTAATAAAR